MVRRLRIRLTLEVGVHIADVTHFLRPGTVGIPRQPEMLGAWRIMSRRADRCLKSLFQTLFDSIGHWQVLVGHRLKGYRPCRRPPWSRGQWTGPRDSPIFPRKSRMVTIMLPSMQFILVSFFSHSCMVKFRETMFLVDVVVCFGHDLDALWSLLGSWFWTLWKPVAGSQWHFGGSVFGLEVSFCPGFW